MARYLMQTGRFDDEERDRLVFLLLAYEEVSRDAAILMLAYEEVFPFRFSDLAERSHAYH